MKLYVAGTLAGAKKLALNTKGNDLYIGIRPDEDAENVFDGVIDDAYIYDRFSPRRKALGVAVTITSA